MDTKWQREETFEGYIIFEVHITESKHRIQIVHSDDGSSEAEVTLLNALGQRLMDDLPANWTFF